MSNIPPTVFHPDLAPVDRTTDPVARTPRFPPAPPVVTPPAVILPRTAAWLNGGSESQGDTAAAETIPVPTETGQSGSGYAQASSATAVYAQASVAPAVSANWSYPDSSPASAGSVVQVV
jgi:hypothetical protein